MSFHRFNIHLDKNCTTETRVFSIGGGCKAINKYSRQLRPVNEPLKGAEWMASEENQQNGMASAGGR